MVALTVVTTFSSEQSWDWWLLIIFFVSVSSSALYIVLCREDSLKQPQILLFIRHMCCYISHMFPFWYVGIVGVYGWYRYNTHSFHIWCDYLFILHNQSSRAAFFHYFSPTWHLVLWIAFPFLIASCFVVGSENLSPALQYVFQICQILETAVRFVFFWDD